MLLTDESLLQYKKCRLRTFLNFYGDRTHKSAEKDFCRKLKKEKISHSQDVLESYNLPYERPRHLVGKKKKKKNVFNLAQMTEELYTQLPDSLVLNSLTH